MATVVVARWEGVHFKPKPITLDEVPATDAAAGGV
jgi:hypothetical protein